jgi:hypothetical protein
MRLCGKKYCTAGQAMTMPSGHMRFACCFTKATDTHSENVIFIVLPPASMDTGTRLEVTLDVAPHLTAGPVSSCTDSCHLIVPTSQSHLAFTVSRNGYVSIWLPLGVAFDHSISANDESTSGGDWICNFPSVFEAVSVTTAYHILRTVYKILNFSGTYRKFGDAQLQPSKLEL